MPLSIYLLCVAGFVVGLVVLAVCFLRGAMADAADAPAPIAPVVRKRRGPLADGFCPECGAPGVYLRKDQKPNARYHRCHVMYSDDTLTGAASANPPWVGTKGGAA